MGLTVDRSSFSDGEYAHAHQRLRENLTALQILLNRPGFGCGEASLGAEIELCIIDEEAQALPVNREVLEASLDPHVQLELDRFNLEYNLSPVAAAGTPFSSMRRDLEQALSLLNAAAEPMAGRIIPIGILPTLTLEQLQAGAMTDRARYRALQEGIKRIRQEDFHIRIDGAEPLELDCDSVTIEGANTSFQVHLRVDPEQFAKYYNAAQLVTPLALAVAANSPFLLGHRLWDETRIALFKQAVDTRGARSPEWRRVSRVPFGHGWLRSSAFELFAEACHLYKVLIPVCGDEDVVAIAEAGEIPELLELRMQQGTIWNWNRAIYDSASGGHLRIEFRALPSGPTAIDMAANAAFLVGLTTAMSERIDGLLPAFPFRYAEYNFYRAAQASLGAELLWPSFEAPSPAAHPAIELCREHLGLADEGLDRLGVAESERHLLLGIIRDRLDKETTPASWQRRTLARLERSSRTVALRDLVECYLEQSSSGLPVTEWQ